MKKMSIIIVFLIAVMAANSQDIAPFQWEDKKAKVIDHTILDQLLYKNWHCYERKFTYKRKHRKVNPGYQIYFNENKTCQITIGGTEEAGTWKIINGNLLDIQLVDSEKYKNMNHNLVGGHSLYKIDKNQLILVKTLTSDYDNKIVLYFETEEQSKSRALAEKALAMKRWEERHQKSSYQKNIAEAEMIEAEPIPDYYQDLRQEVKAAYFMRGKKVPTNINALNRTDLEKLLKEVKQ